MKHLRFVMVSMIVGLAFGCGGEGTPQMLGKEALENLPPDPKIKLSPQSKKIQAEGPAGMAPSGPGGGMEVK